MARTCHSLVPVQKPHIRFDVNDPEHLKAFHMVCIGDDPIQQHPTLRFELEQPFVDIPAMMLHRVGQAYISSKGK